MKKYCDVNAFSDRLKHYHTWQRCPLYWIEICSLFFLSSRMFVLTPCAVQVAVMSDLWHFWMNLVVYILSHAMFSKGMLHWSALADALQHHECDHYVQMKKKKIYNFCLYSPASAFLLFSDSTILFLMTFEEREWPLNEATLKICMKLKHGSTICVTNTLHCGIIMFYDLIGLK